MSNILRISEAASLAMHAVAYLAGVPGSTAAKPYISVKNAGNGNGHSSREIAGVLEASEHHLSKVLGRLARAGIVRSVRGPRGGFRLAGDSSGITLLDVYEALEGPLRPAVCLFHTKVCRGDDCILGGLVERLNREVIEYLSQTRLSDLKTVFREEG